MPLHPRYLSLLSLKLGPRVTLRRCSTRQRTITIETPSLWDLASHPLRFTSYSSEWGDNKSETKPGSQLLELSSDWMADRCVYDPNLLDALEDSAQVALEPILATQALVNGWMSIRRYYEDKDGIELSSEKNVERFLNRTWIAHAEEVLSHFVKEKKLGRRFCTDATDSTQHQQPNILRLIDHNKKKVDVGLIEFKSEGIVRNFWEEVVNRAKRQVKVDWEGMGRWDTVDKIIVKVAAYLAHYKLSWLCWTAASHLLVFRLVRNSGQAPYLVVSGLAQVNDARDPLENLADRRVGERWLPAIMGCALAGIAETGDLQFDFNVENKAIVSGSPTLLPGEIKQHSGSSSVPRKASDSSWTPDALLMFSSASGPRSLAAPLIACSPSRNDCEHQNSSRDDGNEELPRGLLEKGKLRSSLIPKLEVGTKLGEGSTGAVYEGSWKNMKVVVKIAEGVAEGVDERERLENEGGWYVWLSQQRTRKVGLPTFLGWYRHTLFDVLVMSHEGDQVASWDDLSENERYDLFSIACELHQAGLRHGDIEPRNVLRSKTGQMCLVDLSEASEHVCLIPQKINIPFSDKRLPPDIELCGELASLCIDLSIEQDPGPGGDENHQETE